MSTRVTELSIDELRALVEDAVRRVLHEETQQDKQDKQITERPPLDIPILDVGPWPDNLTIRREDMYGDDER